MLGGELLRFIVQEKECHKVNGSVSVGQEQITMVGRHQLRQELAIYTSLVDLQLLQAIWMDSEAPRGCDGLAWAQRPDRGHAVHLPIRFLISPLHPSLIFPIVSFPLNIFLRR